MVFFFLRLGDSLPSADSSLKGAFLLCSGFSRDFLKTKVANAAECLWPAQRTQFGHAFLELKKKNHDFA